ncbi:MULTISPECIES: hypothetical protein [Ralstonia]|uniref:hypothetical protein n=1 Tax=Ralstonia TaxID=48736 RepID=UPI0011AFB513|nr:MULTISPECIES: hypothetical protein [Ralstonia]
MHKALIYKGFGVIPKTPKAGVDDSAPANLTYAACAAYESGCAGNVPSRVGYQAVLRFFLASEALSDVASTLAARFENPRVGGSIPPQATKILRSARSIDFAEQQKRPPREVFFLFRAGFRHRAVSPFAAPINDLRRSVAATKNIPEPS